MSSLIKSTESMFRDKSTNQRLTKALFLEESYTDKTYVVYTLKNRDHEGYISLYKRYIDMSDPLERDFANVYFEDYEHWLMVCNASWFKPLVEKWRKELNLKLRSEALNRIRMIAQDEGNKASFAANKLLLDGSWQTPEEKSKVGRPSKEEIRKQADSLFLSEKDAMEDLKRIQ